MSPDEPSAKPSSVDPTCIDPPNAIPDGVYCVRCGYHLRGVVGDRCPECGYDLAGLRSTESGLPWAHRRTIGRLRAYWATVWAVTVRTREFCEEHAREVSYRDARLFQWVTILHAIPAVMFGVWGYALKLREHVEERLAFQQGTFMPTVPSIIDKAILENWPWVVLTACLVVFLVASTGVPSYFFHPRESPTARQNAGIAMSYYTCAPLAIALIPASRMVMMSLLPDAVTIGAILALPLLWWYNLLRLAKGVMPELRRTHIYVGVLIPMVWLLLGGLILIVLPAVAFWGVVVVDSLL